MSVTIGTDPEFFLEDDRNGNLIPVCGLLGGTKGAPLDLGDGFGVQEDNVMVEWNMPPVTSPDGFADNTVQGLARVMDFVHTKLPHARRAALSSVEFPKKLLTSEQSMEFGCSPDFDAYTRGDLVNPLDPTALNTDKGARRFAGGHIHIGYDNPNDVPEFVVASLCDARIGLRAVYVGEKQGARRELYGMPGRFRPTDYGIEYRTPSNFWLANWDFAYLMADEAIRVGRLVERAPVEYVLGMFRDMPWNDVRRAIIHEDEELARDLLRHVNATYGRY